jgi:hypothetical protein
MNGKLDRLNLLQKIYKLDIVECIFKPFSHLMKHLLTDGRAVAATAGDGSGQGGRSNR